MNGFEHINETLDTALNSQLNVLDMLGDSLLTPADVGELLDNSRRLHRLVELTNITLIRALRDRQAFEPNARPSFNAQMQKGLYSRKELKDISRLSDDLFDTPPSLGIPEGKPAAMPNTRRGLVSAQFGIAAAMEIVRVLDRVPENSPPETIEWVEQTLAELAAALTPDDLRTAGLKILQGLNADDEPSEKERQRRRRVDLSKQGADLMSSLSADITPELDALFRRLFADYAGPGDLLPEGERENDTRTAGQRRHDALAAALKTALHPQGPMPPTRGCSTVVATMTLEQLATAAGVVLSDVGTMLPIKDLLRLGADKNAFLAILDEETGNLIELGKSKRAADLYAYLGLVASQGGDMTPGSDLSAAMSEIHHIKAWRHGGLSTGDNLTFAGHRVHRNIDDTRTNPRKWWTFCDRSGQMLWQPPSDIDPERRPQASFNPMRWFSPGQMMRFGLHVPHKTPPFQMETAATEGGNCRCCG